MKQAVASGEGGDLNQNAVNIMEKQRLDLELVEQMHAISKKHETIDSSLSARDRRESPTAIGYLTQR